MGHKIQMGMTSLCNKQEATQVFKSTGNPENFTLILKIGWSFWNNYTERATCMSTTKTAS